MAKYNKYITCQCSQGSWKIILDFFSSFFFPLPAAVFFITVSSFQPVDPPAAFQPYSQAWLFWWHRAVNMYSTEPVGVVKTGGCMDRGHPSLAFSDVFWVEREEQEVTGLFTLSVCIVSTIILLQNQLQKYLWLFLYFLCTKFVKIILIPCNVQICQSFCCRGSGVCR